MNYRRQGILSSSRQDYLEKMDGTASMSLFVQPTGDCKFNTCILPPTAHTHTQSQTHAYTSINTHIHMNTHMHTRTHTRTHTASQSEISSLSLQSILRSHFIHI